MPKADWRSSEPYECLQTSDAPTFAWEFLDRNTEFHAEITQLLSDQSEPSAQTGTRASFAARWGVRFRRRPRKRGGLTKLDPGRASDEAGPRRYAAEPSPRIIWLGPLPSKHLVGGAGSNHPVARTNPSAFSRTLGCLYIPLRGDPSRRTPQRQDLGAPPARRVPAGNWPRRESSGAYARAASQADRGSSRT